MKGRRILIFLQKAAGPLFKIRVTESYFTDSCDMIPAWAYSTSCQTQTGTLGRATVTEPVCLYHQPVSLYLPGDPSALQWLCEDGQPHSWTVPLLGSSQHAQNHQDQFKTNYIKPELVDYPDLYYKGAWEPQTQIFRPVQWRQTNPRDIPLKDKYAVAILHLHHLRDKF